ncbi:MAG: protein translocase subunit SecF [Candidatus Spechtbacterales bacterium]|nr:protein translocase subunit SecF [Candidatus Spechtbacterales bacterium]
MTVKYRKYFYIFSAVLVTVSIVALAVFRLPLGIDFKGGSLLEVQFQATEEGNVDVPEISEIQGAFNELELGSVQVQVSEDNTMLLRFADVKEQRHQEILNKIDEITESEFEELRFDSVGPVIGIETAERSVEAIIIVSIMIVVYVAWAFRKIHQPIGSVRYGFIAIVALLHDIIITTGVFAIYAYLAGAEVGVPFIAALLTILGYSVNDTIIIFDRVRENLNRFGSRIEFSEIVAKSVRENITRSVFTSLTTLLVLFSILVFGGATIQDFILTLIIGIFIGTYSSIALASPLLVSWAERLSSR